MSELVRHSQQDLSYSQGFRAATSTVQKKKNNGVFLEDNRSLNSTEKANNPTNQSIVSNATIQLKNRIDTSKLEGEKKLEVEAKITILRDKRTKDKKELTAAWVTNEPVTIASRFVKSSEATLDGLVEEKKELATRVKEINVRVESGKRGVATERKSYNSALRVSNRKGSKRPAPSNHLLLGLQRQLITITRRKEELQASLAEKKRQIKGLEAKIKENKDILKNADNQYNKALEIIRTAYEKAIVGLIKSEGLDPKLLISGDDYYGEEVSQEEEVTKNPVFRRPDTGKEYVKDVRGTFVPRFVRRELNFRDVEGDGSLKEEITTTGKSTLEQVTENAKSPVGGTPLTFKQREFVQQSSGGGDNQYLQSHTSTKRPILSNAHDSFGGPPKGGYKHAGAVITDLAQIDKEKLAAQWTLGDSGQKKPLERSDFDQSIGNDKRRDVVRMSGYRNMEVLTNSIPKEAMMQPDKSWKGEEGTIEGYKDGESQRGQSLAKFKTRMAQLAFEKAKYKTGLPAFFDPISKPKGDGAGSEDATVLDSPIEPELAPVEQVVKEQPKDDSELAFVGETPKEEI